MLAIRSPKDFTAGLLFACIGAAAIAYGSRYNLGTAARMGPGYFPRALGLILIGFGLVIVVRSLRRDGLPFDRLRPRAFVVLAALLLFSLIVARLGVLISVFCLTLLSASASTQFRLKESLVAAVALAAFSALIFVQGLGVQLPILPRF